MDQGLKERLVGAAVLVAIAVWLIPWVLDGPEGGAEPPSSSLQLPAAEEPMPMRTQTLKLGDAPEPSVTPPTVPATTPAAQQAAAPVDPPKPAAASRSEREGEQTVAVATQEHAPAKTDAAPATPKATAAGDWTVQLGSFEDEANAKRMAQRAGTYGYKAEVSSYKRGTRTLYRVRVGPQATKAASDATASALRAHGVEASVVAAR
jgi:DedD protein